MCMRGTEENLKYEKATGERIYKYERKKPNKLHYHFICEIAESLTSLCAQFIIIIFLKKKIQQDEMRKIKLHQREKGRTFPFESMLVDLMVDVHFINTNRIPHVLQYNTVNGWALSECTTRFSSIGVPILRPWTRCIWHRRAHAFNPFE